MTLSDNTKVGTAEIRMIVRALRYYSKKDGLHRHTSSYYNVLAGSIELELG